MIRGQTFTSYFLLPSAPGCGNTERLHTHPVVQSKKRERTTRIANEKLVNFYEKIKFSAAVAGAAAADLFR